MNIDQYFKERADLVLAALLDAPVARLSMPDWRVYGAGFACIAAATSMEMWASISQPDPGFFARTTIFLGVVLLAGTWLVSISQLADFLGERVAVRSRDALKEKTLGQLLKIDGSIAHKDLQGSSRAPS